MTLPGFDADQPAMHPLEAAAKRHVDRLRAAGLITDAHDLLVALVLHLASQIRWAKSYALPQLSRELREALAELPTEAAGDTWDQLLAAIQADADADDVAR